MTDRLTLIELVDELTLPIVHREHYQVPRTNHDGTTTWVGNDHVTVHPPLITQLWDATHQGANPETEGRPGYGSKPPSRTDAIDTAVKIDLAAARWVRDLGHDDPIDTMACIRLLGSLMPNQPPITVKAATHDVRSWWTWCRILTGWDTPAWKPDNTCPLCAKRGSLRIKLADAAGMCVDCHETWDREHIGLLAEHIRRENQDDGDQDDDTPTQAAS